MRSDVHTAALRAAAKVAFSVAFLGGCTAATSVPEGTETDKSADELSSGCHAPKDAGAPKPTCDELVAAAFPTVGNYPGVKQSVSAEVQACCGEMAAKGGVALGAHRWDCCANLPDDAGENSTIACTPWGPPVPPAMKRRVGGGERAEPMLAEVA